MQQYALWADKYEPKSLKDIVGGNSIVTNINNWLNKPSNKRAVLLSGPPGVGKTTTARLIAKTNNREVLELNASDARSKNLISSILPQVIDAPVLSFEGTVRQRLIIMDEVDGMSSSDRGGVSELIKLIKTSKTPIICICNDMSKSSMRTLARHCLHIKFTRPNPASITQRIKHICAKEELSVDNETLQLIIADSGNDIRQILNTLQMWSTSSKELGHSDYIGRSSLIKKDKKHRLSSFDAARFIFSQSHLATLNELSDAYFVDHDIIPLMVSEHYLSAATKPNTDTLKQLKNIQMAADQVCDADECGKYVHQKCQWTLLPSEAMLNIRIAYQANGHISFPSFPEWLGKNSSHTKKLRQLSDMSHRMRSNKVSIDKYSLRFDYIPTMREVFMRQLTKEPPQEVIDGLVDNLDEYALDRDDLFETLPSFNLGEANSAITTKTKAAFTRSYNKRSHKSQYLTPESPIRKKIRS